MKRLTKKDKVLTLLKEGRRLTPMEALREAGSFRLSAVIHDLKDEGYPIKKRLIAVNGRFGVSRVAEYWLENRSEHG